MINYIASHQTLVVLAEQEPHDMAEELQRHDCTNLGIHGTPANLQAIGRHPTVEDVSLTRCKVPDVSFLEGLPRLRVLNVAFGPIASVDLAFCAETLESLSLARLRKLKDLSNLPLMPRLDFLSLQHLPAFESPDFRLFPKLRHLTVWKTKWPSLKWLSQIPQIELLHISQIEVADGDWRPLLELPRLTHLHGLQSVFGAVVRKEFSRLRPEVVVDCGIPSDIDKFPRLKEFMEEEQRKVREESERIRAALRGGSGDKV
jgi:hypothetical protein